jgi:hypothetical protein
MSQPEQSDNSIPYREGALYGAAAFVVSYAAVFALYTYELGEKTADFSEAFYGNTEVAGWLLYAANRVPLQTTIKFRERSPTNTHTGNIIESVYGAFQAQDAASITESQRTMLNYFFGGPGASADSLGLAGPGGAMGEVTGSMVVPKLVYYAVPVLLLVGAGYVATRKVAGSKPLSDKQRVLTGASIALGYAGLAIAGAMTVFSASTDEIAVYTVEPQIGGTAVAMLVLYPAVTGAVGGYLAD